MQLQETYRVMELLFQVMKNHERNYFRHFYLAVFLEENFLRGCIKYKIISIRSYTCKKMCKTGCIFNLLAIKA